MLTGVAESISYAADFYNGALQDGRMTGPNADEVISILTQYTFIKDPQVHREITPPAIDPDGRMNVSGLRNDLQFFKDLLALPRRLQN